MGWDYPWERGLGVLGGGFGGVAWFFRLSGLGEVAFDFGEDGGDGLAFELVVIEDELALFAIDLVADGGEAFIGPLFFADARDVRVGDANACGGVDGFGVGFDGAAELGGEINEDAEAGEGGEGTEGELASDVHGFVAFVGELGGEAFFGGVFGPVGATVFEVGGVGIEVEVTFWPSENAIVVEPAADADEEDADEEFLFFPD